MSGPPASSESFVASIHSEPANSTETPIKINLADTEFHSVTIKDKKCLICKDWVLMRSRFPFGLLEHCSHAFCAMCIVSFRQVHNHQRCPKCQVESRRVLIWPQWVESREQKRKIFRLQEQGQAVPGQYVFVYRGCMAVPMQIWNNYPSVRRLFFAGCFCYVVAMVLDLAIHFFVFLNSPSE